MIKEIIKRGRTLGVTFGITIFLLMLIGPVDAASGNRVWKEGMHTIYASMSGFAKAAGEVKEVTFRKEVSQFPGNYTIEVLCQKKTVEVKEAPFNVFPGNDE